MDWRSSCEIEITDLGDRLEVLARTHTGALSWLFTAVGAPVAVYMFWRANQILAVCVAGMVVFSLLNSLRKGNETRLMIRPDGFIAEGNIHRTFAQRVTVSVNDLHSIGYFVGNEHDPHGLYALGRWSQTCMVPGIDEKTCRKIQSAIETKFPQMHFGQEPLAGILGDEPKIITLGLNGER